MDWSRVFEVSLGAILAFIFGFLLQWWLIRRQERFQKELLERQLAFQERLENQRAKEARAALVDKYEERFFERMKDERELAAKFLLGERSDSGELEDVLDYFEAPIAEKVEAGEVDAERIYNVFYHWVRLYWQASRRFVEKYRREEPAAWGNIKTLYKIISEFEKRTLERKLGRRVTDEDLKLTPEKLDEYL